MLRLVVCLLTGLSVNIMAKDMNPVDLALQAGEAVVETAKNLISSTSNKVMRMVKKVEEEASHLAAAARRQARKKKRAFHEWLEEHRSKDAQGTAAVESESVTGERDKYIDSLVYLIAQLESADIDLQRKVDSKLGKDLEDIRDIATHSLNVFRDEIMSVKRLLVDTVKASLAESESIIQTLAEQFETKLKQNSDMDKKQLAVEKKELENNIGRQKRHIELLNRTLGIFEYEVARSYSPVLK